MSYVIPPECKGSRFKPIAWPEGWGIAERTKGKQAYTPKAWEGKWRSTDL